MNSSILKILVGLFLLGILTQCGETAYYEKNIDLKASNWYADSILTFKFKVDNANQKFDFFYNIRNTVKYPYYNLYVTYYLEDSKGKVLATDLQNITLFDSKRGKPFGSGVSNIRTHQLEIASLKKYKFPAKGSYIFKLKQYMRQNPLNEIQMMGLRIEQ